MSRREEAGDEEAGTRDQGSRLGGLRAEDGGRRWNEWRQEAVGWRVEGGREDGDIRAKRAAAEDARRSEVEVGDGRWEVVGGGWERRRPEGSIGFALPMFACNRYSSCSWE